jgi:hypothetical protein
MIRPFLFPKLGDTPSSLRAEWKAPFRCLLKMTIVRGRWWDNHKCVVGNCPFQDWKWCYKKYIFCHGHTWGNYCAQEILVHWPPVWLVWNQLYADWQLFWFQNSLIQTSQTGGQWYSDTSPFSIPCCADHYYERWYFIKNLKRKT